MTGLSRRCPDPEAIAAFVMGNLSGAELKTMADHLRECEDCREIAAEAARIDRDGVPSPVTQRAAERGWPWWVAAAAAALAGVVFMTLWSTLPHGSGSAMRTLIEASPRDGRYLEPRLTGGFAWAPLRNSRRGADEPLDAGQMKLVGAAGKVLDETAKSDSVDSRHAAALAHLLAGRPEEAAALMEDITRSSSDASVWSDLAASRYARSLQLDDPTGLAEALAAADAALRLSPALPEALFNRALILERLGLRDQARAAWQRYLAVDGASPWANEARHHLQTLTPLAEFPEELQRQYALLGADAVAARSLAHEFPQDARVWGETEILGRWAEATLRGDTAAAAAHLRVANAFAEELASHGEKMLARAVAAIDSADGGRREELAHAHLLFREAQRTYKRHEAAAAEQMFAAAATAFERGGSPVALVARYFAANTIFDQGRIPEAQVRLAELIATAPSEFPAHRAQLGWQIGLVQASLGRWGAAIETLSASASAFEHLREIRYANTVRDLLAEVYDRIGDRRTAWRYRMASLRELGRSDPRRLGLALDAAARAAALNRDWDVSVALLGLQVDVLSEGSDDLLLVETLLQRAWIRGRVGDANAARDDLTTATRAIGRLHDASLSEQVEADRLAVEALLSPAAEALPLLTRAIEFHRVKGRRMHLPELLLERGRAYVSAHDLKAAAADFQSGITELEAQRVSMSADERGWATFAVAADLFDDAIALALARGDTAGAFAYSERAHGGDENRSERPSVPAVQSGAAVFVEYASLPKELVIFVDDGDGVRAFSTPVARAALAAETERLSASALASDTARFRASAATLYQRLIGPVAVEVNSRRMIVFVPDPTLSVVPFSALLDGSGQYLIEQHEVIVASSCASFARLAARPRLVRTTPRLLLLTGPASKAGDIGSISSAQREADAIAAEYGVRLEQAPARDDGKTFELQAADADVIHFVGHAVIPDGASEAALVTSTSPGAAGRLEANEIAAMRFPHTRTVVLAACGTARGRERRGETSISLARAFLAAGVPSVVATLWPIEDGPASEFFPRFHRYLIEGRSPAEALRAVQLEWIHRPDTPPGMWAAVQLIGS